MHAYTGDQETGDVWLSLIEVDTSSLLQTTRIEDKNLATKQIAN